MAKNIKNRKKGEMKMRTKHTPGPWKLGAGRSFETKDGTFHLSYGTDECGVPGFKDFCALDVNARLISACPELLQACKAAHVSLIGDEHYQEFQEVIKTLEAAIRKAEGKD